MGKLVISIPGHNYTAIERFLSLNSEVLTQRVFLEGVETVVIPAWDFREIVINHNLGYAPTFQVYHTFDATNTFRVTFGFSTLFGLDASVDCWMNNNQLHLYLDNASGTPRTMTVKYLIYATDMI